MISYNDLLPDIIQIVKYYVKTVHGSDTNIYEEYLYEYLIRKCHWGHFNPTDPVQGIITCLHKHRIIFQIDDYLFETNTHKYDVYDVTINIGEYINWRNTWLHQYINEYADDKYYSGIYYDTFKPIISIVIIPFERSITLTPYEINGFIYK